LGKAVQAEAKTSSNLIKEHVDLTDFRKDHILNRHRAGSGKPGKTEFPANWSDSKILVASASALLGGHFIGDIMRQAKYDLFEVVRLTKSIPEEGLNAGAIGAIVMIYAGLRISYEVEFVDAQGKTLNQVVLAEDFIEKIL
jgi:hypothetical protein